MDRDDRSDQSMWLAGGTPELERRAVVAAVAAIVVWTIGPLLVAARYEATLELYVDPSAYAAFVGGAFGLTAWLLVDGLDLDRLTVGYAVAFGPLLLAGVVVPSLAFLGAELSSFVIQDRFLRYPLAITAGGLVALGLSLVTERLSTGHSAFPERRTVALAAGTTAVLGLGAAVGRRYATPPSGAIDDVFLGYHRWGVTARVALETESAPLHVTVVAPDGTVTRSRVSDDERDAVVTMQVPYPDDSLHTGRFDVRLEDAVGRTIDSASVTVDDGPIPSIRRVETRTTGRNSRIADVVVGNDGDVSGEFELRLRGDGERLDGTDLSIGAGDETEDALVIDHDDREGTRDAVVTAQFDGPESDERADREAITFPDR